jgi:hypothetical protein
MIMYAREFLYWLQGFKEISDANSGTDKDQKMVLSKQQEKVIQDHLSLVAQCEPEKDFEKNPCYGFCAWLMVTLCQKGDRDWDQIFTRLNNVFEHVVDPSYEGDQKVLGAIHAPSHQDFSSQLIRC